MITPPTAAIVFSACWKKNQLVSRFALERRTTCLPAMEVPPALLVNLGVELIQARALVT